MDERVPRVEIIGVLSFIPGNSWSNDQVSRLLLRGCTVRIEEKISIARLPVTGSDIFGREEDIAFLDDAWGKPEFKCRYHSCQGWCWEVHARQPLASRDGR
jgi:hypothetical protein